MTKIMLIDDDNELRATLADLLGASGYDVQSAASGDEAIEMLKSGLPDALVVDLMMPHKDGIMTIQEILRSYPRAKVIAISGGPGGNPSWLPIAKSVGALAVLKKPFTNERLQESIKEVLANPWR